MDVSVQASGAVDVVKRQSGNFSMAVEQWTISSTFSQPTEFRLFRPAQGSFAGQLGGAPAALFGIVKSNDESDLFDPVPSPLDAVTQTFAGEIKVTGCATNTSTLTKGMRTPKLPPGVQLPIPLESLGMVDKGAFYARACPMSPDQILVFYLPPPGFYNAPAVAPIKCNEDYSYERDERPGVTYDSSLLEESYVAEAKLACPRYAAEPGPYAFVGSASWRELVAGRTFTLEKTYNGLDGQPDQADEPYTRVKVSLKVVLRKKVQ